MVLARTRLPRLRRPARAAAVLGAAAALCIGLSACNNPVLPILKTASSSGSGTATRGHHGGGQGGQSDQPGPTVTTTTPTPTGTSTTTAPPVTTTTTNPNCTLAVPRNPLSAAGLATPYTFSATNPADGACHETNADQSAFVEATILDPATGALRVYDPLVVDADTQPAAPPVVPALPRNAVIGIWFGFQADNLTLQTASAVQTGRLGPIRRAGHGRGTMTMRIDPADANTCVNGFRGSLFSQFAYCGAPQFFAAANRVEQAGLLKVPALGTGIDGQPCPTTRDFTIVDQDQSDNLPTEYLALPDGRTAQDNPRNTAALAGSTVLTNASDNGLVDRFMDPTLHCKPFTAPNISSGGAPSSSLALNELQAAADQAAPQALVPLDDPMTTIDGATSTPKTNLYRVGVDQLPIGTGIGTDNGSGATYCTNLGAIGPKRFLLDKQFTNAVASPDPAAATTLFGFLANRLVESWGNLGCPALINQPPPLAVTGNADGVVTDAALTTTTSATTTPTPTTTGTAITTVDPTSANPTTSVAPTTTVAPVPTTTTTPTTTTPATTATTKTAYDAHHAEHRGQP